MSRARLALLAGVTTLLVLAGATTAYGVWSTSATLNSTAVTATVGVTHALSGSTLAVTYNGTTTAAVGVVTVTNTGSRDGTYSLAISATSSSTSLRSAVAVTVGTAAVCTTTATLTAPSTGTFAATLTTTGAIAAGASIALCVRTSMTAANVSANPSTSLAASIATGITVGTWTAAASPAITFAQSVAAPVVTSFASVEANRYKIYNANVCVSSTWSFDVFARGAVCENDQTSNWRLLDDASGAKYVSRAYNTSTAPSNRWNAASSTATTLAATATTAAQRWFVTARADGLYQFQSAQYPTQCLSVASNNAAVLAACNASSAAQGYTFELVADAAPAPVTLSCGGNGTNWIYYSWPVLAGYQAEVTYKVYVDGVFYANHTDGYYTTEQFKWEFPGVLAFGAGSHAIQVRQSVAGGAYTVTGNGTLVMAAGTNNMTCG